MQVMTAIENASPKRRGHRYERLTATSITGQFVLAKRTQDSLDTPHPAAHSGAGTERRGADQERMCVVSRAGFLSGFVINISVSENI